LATVQVALRAPPHRSAEILVRLVRPTTFGGQECPRSDSPPEQSRILVSGQQPLV
jgi:hypothetical protein